MAALGLQLGQQVHDLVVLVVDAGGAVEVGRAERVQRVGIIHERGEAVLAPVVLALEEGDDLVGLAAPLLRALRIIILLLGRLRDHEGAELFVEVVELRPQQLVPLELLAELIHHASERAAAAAAATGVRPP